MFFELNNESFNDVSRTESRQLQKAACLIDQLIDFLRSMHSIFPSFAL